MSAAVSVVTWRHAAMRTPRRGFSFANRAPMDRSTGMSFFAHSIRFRPAAASRMSLTSYPFAPAISPPALRAVPGCLAQRTGLVGLLPRELRELPPEVPEGRRLPVDRPEQVQLPDDPRGP